jgi:MoaA/NifB/PqqE/SkfB family radical SAM enzyme
MNREPRRHMRRMLNRANAERIAQLAVASSTDDWAAIAPVFVTLDLTWNCNYDCVDCIDTMARDQSYVVRKRQGGDPLEPYPAHCEGPYLREPVISSVVRFVQKYGVRGVQVMGGEALMHPDIDAVLAAFAGNNVPVELVSNGSLIAKHIDSLTEMLKVDGSWLRVSINGWNGYGQRVGWPKHGADLRARVIDGLSQLLHRVPADKRDRILVSTVAFEDALRDLHEIADELARIGVPRMAVIRERRPDVKEFVGGQEEIARTVTERTKEIRRRLDKKLRIDIADNIVVEPKAQEKDYCPCPAAILKAVLGADGYLYACTDHRGCRYAQLAALEDYNNDLETAWRSEARIDRALQYAPAQFCTGLVCQRFEGNTAISMLRSHHDTWTF